jgi:hypothetical protein
MIIGNKGVRRISGVSTEDIQGWFKEEGHLEDLKTGSENMRLKNNGMISKKKISYCGVKRRDL